ncbi:MAG: hypothetical protein U5L06_03465 [Rhodovibrio sp.]|nr:hypothetical protein [Rhodovibrio sp.]
MRQRVQAAEAAVADFRIESGLAERGPETLATRQRVSELNRALAQARAEAAAARARLQPVSATGPDAMGSAAAPSAPAPTRADRAPPPTGSAEGTGTAAGGPEAGLGRALTSQLIQGLRRQEFELERTRAQLATRYGPRHPRLREANAELLDLRLLIDEETSRVGQTLRQDADLARARADALQAELQEVERGDRRTRPGEVKLAQLKREAAAERALFDTFLTRLKETRVGADSPGRMAELITRAHPPTQPAAPNRPLLAGFGVLAGGGHRGRVRAAARGARPRGAQPGTVAAPDRSARPGGRAAGPPRPGGPRAGSTAGALAEALRGLYTALLLADIDRPPRTILVTSALPGEGKTALAGCLARVLARSGNRVLLIDADLRYPRVAHTLKLPAGPGLSELLTRQCTLEAALQRDPAPELDGRLSVLPAGRASDPGRLLDSERLGALVAELAAADDAVLIDAPPVLAVADPRTLSARVDATLLAVRWARTPRTSVQRAVTLLREAGAELAGTAMVRVDPRHHVREANGPSGAFGTRRRYYVGT